MGVAIPLGFVEDRASGALVVDGSLRFDSSKSQYLTRTPSSVGNRRTFTWSGWIKNGRINTSAEQTFWGAGPNQSATTADSNTLFGIFYNGVSQINVGSAVYAWKETTAYQRDYSGWYHYVLSVDTTASTAATRLKLWINNVQQTFSTDRDLYSAADTAINNTTAHNIGRNVSSSSRYFDGEMSQVYFIDGQALDASYFGYTDALTNTWRPKRFKPQATPNNGTVWSNYWSGSILDGYPATGSFDGNLATSTRTGGGTLTWTSPSSIPFTTLRLYAGRDGSPTGAIYVNGTNVSSQFGVDASWVTVTGVSSPLTSISLQEISGQYPRLAAVEVNGVILLDSDTSNIGKNGFYLPFDGSAPIGQDQSGRGNNWTPVNFGGSNTLEKATGALPILNTDGGGKIARVGVRTDATVAAGVGTCVLALPLVGIASDFSNRVDGRSTQKVITVGGASAITTVSNFYGGSYSFNGSNNYISAGSSTVYELSSNFTVECWVYFNSAVQQNLVAYYYYQDGIQEEGWVFGLTSAGKIRFRNSWGTTEIISTSTFLTGTWYHVAAVINGGTSQIYINGIADGASGNIGTPYYGGSVRLTLGASIYAGQGNGYFGFLNGYIQDLRIYKGIAKYTSNFIPASTDPDILPDTPSGVSYTSNLTQITDGSVALDGSGDYLSLADSDDFSFGSGDFTVEAFIYPQSFANEAMIAGQWSGDLGGTGLNWALMLDGSSNGYLRLLTSSNGSSVLFDLSTSTYSLTLNKWNHIAAVRNGNIFTLYIDGISRATTTNASSLYNATNVFTVGSESNSITQYFNGFISNLHVVKGTALYTANFTPPTAGISSVANTKLLCCKSNVSAVATEVSPGFIGPTITAAGNAAASSTNPFSSGTAGSISLDGSGDYLQASGSFWSAHSPATFEAWIYCTNLSSGPNIFETGGQGDFSILSDGTLRIHPVAANYADTASSTITTNTWYHIALVQTSTTRKVFVGGVEKTLTNVGGNGLTSNWNNPTGNPGFGKAGTYRADFPGNMSNIRISEYEVYTSNFTPRTTPFDTITEANSLLTAFSRTLSTASSGTNAKATNFNPFTVNINTQRGKQSGYATLNAVDNNGGTLSNGNLTKTTTGATNVSGTIAMPSGKWYWEITVTRTVAGGVLGIGAGSAMAGTALSSLSKIYGYAPDGNKYANTTASSYGSSYTTGDIIAVKFDADTRQLEFLKNNISQGVAFTVDSGFVYFPQLHLNDTDITINFGQKPFKFPPPAGFQPLALANTPRPTIVRPDQYVGVTTYIGNGGTQTVNVGLKPDFIWTKSRTQAYSHNIYDSVRGVSKNLFANETSAENTDANTIKAFNSNGFQVGVNDNGNYTNGGTAVAWCWKAGGNSNTFNINDVGYATASAAGLTAGTITPTGASVNTKSGFSIITYTGTGSAATISHGIGQAPAFMMFKQRTATGGTSGVTNWRYYHTSLGNTKAFYVPANTLNTSSSFWNNTSPTSTVFTIGTDDGVNDPGSGFICYAWAEIPGFSKFGSVTLAASADDAYINLGFRPRWFMIKGTTSSNWIILDSTRDPFNFVDQELFANLSNAENSAGSTYSFDFLSNGIKCRNQGLTGSFIYAAFAETPTQNLYGAQANAY